MRWLRVREAAGQLVFEYAGGTAGTPGTWTPLASVASPFPVTGVTLTLSAGANTTVADTATFDNVFTS